MSKNLVVLQSRLHTPGRNTRTLNELLLWLWRSAVDKVGFCTCVFNKDKNVTNTQLQQKFNDSQRSGIRDVGILVIIIPA